jgi:hypothetical protein
MHEQRILKVAQGGHGRSVDRDLKGEGVDPKVLVLDDVRRRCVSAHERSHAGQQLGIRERGAEHVIGAGLEGSKNIG